MPTISMQTLTTHLALSSRKANRTQPPRQARMSQYAPNQSGQTATRLTPSQPAADTGPAPTLMPTNHEHNAHLREGMQPAPKHSRLPGAHIKHPRDHSKPGSHCPTRAIA
jgi:hypothetical protein